MRQNIYIINLSGHNEHRMQTNNGASEREILIHDAKNILLQCIHFVRFDFSMHHKFMDHTGRLYWSTWNDYQKQFDELEKKCKKWVKTAIEQQKRNHTFLTTAENRVVRQMTSATDETSDHEETSGHKREMTHGKHYAECKDNIKWWKGKFQRICELNP